MLKVEGLPNTKFEGKIYEIHDTILRSRAYFLVWLKEDGWKYRDANDFKPYDN